MSSAPASESIFALLLISTIVPAPETLFAELHLVLVCFFTFLLDLGVVCVAFTTAGATLTDTGEEEGGKEKSACCTASAVDCKLGTLGKGGELLGHGKGGGFGFDDRLRGGGVATVLS
jgi:hypothetical protein